MGSTAERGSAPRPAARYRSVIVDGRYPPPPCVPVVPVLPPAAPPGAPVVPVGPVVPLGPPLGAPGALVPVPPVLGAALRAWCFFFFVFFLVVVVVSDVPVVPVAPASGPVVPGSALVPVPPPVVPPPVVPLGPEVPIDPMLELLPEGPVSLVAPLLEPVPPGVVLLAPLPVLPGVVLLGELLPAGADDPALPDDPLDWADAPPASSIAPAMIAASLFAMCFPSSGPASSRAGSSQDIGERGAGREARPRSPWARSTLRSLPLEYALEENLRTLAEVTTGGAAPALRAGERALASVRGARPPVVRGRARASGGTARGRPCRRARGRGGA
jgi:hypothetical protein